MTFVTPPNNISSSKYISVYFSQLNKYTSLLYIKLEKIVSIVSNLTCLRLLLQGNILKHINNKFASSF